MVHIQETTLIRNGQGDSRSSIGMITLSNSSKDRDKVRIGIPGKNYFDRIRNEVKQVGNRKLLIMSANTILLPNSGHITDGQENKRGESRISRIRLRR